MISVFLKIQNVMILIKKKKKIQYKIKKFRNMCEFYETPIYFYGEKEALGAAIGCEFRASLAVLDQGLSDSIQKKLEQAGIKNGNGGHEHGDDQRA